MGEKILICWSNKLSFVPLGWGWSQRSQAYDEREEGRVRALRHPGNVEQALRGALGGHDFGSARRFFWKDGESSFDWNGERSESTIRSASFSIKPFFSTIHEFLAWIHFWIWFFVYIFDFRFWRILFSQNCPKASENLNSFRKVPEWKFFQICL